MEFFLKVLLKISVLQRSLFCNWKQKSLLEVMFKKISPFTNLEVLDENIEMLLKNVNMRVNKNGINW